MQLTCATRAKLPTKSGNFEIIAFDGFTDGCDHIALVHGDLTNAQNHIVRVHSECLTGDTFGSLRCDCQAQLHAAQDYIVKNGAGIILYLRQEGRGIGLINKLKAYALQDTKNLDTVDANLALNLPIDARRYDIAAAMLTALKVNQIRLLTNNPDKAKQLQDYGIIISEILPLHVGETDTNRAYIKTKRTRMGHQE